MVYVPAASVHARLTVGSAFEEVTVVVVSLVFPSQPPRLWVYKQGATARLSAIKTYSPVHSTQYTVQLSSYQPQISNLFDMPQEKRTSTRLNAATSNNSGTSAVRSLAPRCHTY